MLDQLFDDLTQYFSINSKLNQLQQNDPGSTLLVYSSNNTTRLYSINKKVNSITDFPSTALADNLLDDRKNSHDFDHLSRWSKYYLYYAPKGYRQLKDDVPNQFYIGTEKAKPADRIFLNSEPISAIKFQVILLRLFLKAITTDAQGKINISLAEIRIKIRDQLAEVIGQLKNENYSEDALKSILLYQIVGGFFNGFNALHLIYMLADDELLQDFCGYFGQKDLITAFKEEAEFGQATPFLMAIFSQSVQTTTLVNLIKDFPTADKQALLESFQKRFCSFKDAKKALPAIHFIASPSLKCLFDSEEEYRQYISHMFSFADFKLFKSILNEHYFILQAIFSDDELRVLIRKIFFIRVKQVDLRKLYLTADEVKILGTLTSNLDRKLQFTVKDDILAVYGAYQEYFAEEQAQRNKDDNEAEVNRQLSKRYETEKNRLVLEARKILDRESQKIHQKLYTIQEVEAEEIVKLTNDAIQKDEALSQSEKASLMKMANTLDNQSKLGRELDRAAQEKFLNVFRLERNNLREKLLAQAKDNYLAALKKAMQDVEAKCNAEKYTLQQQVQVNFEVDSNKRVLDSEASKIEDELDAMVNPELSQNLLQIIKHRVSYPFDSLTNFSFLMMSENITDGSIENLFDKFSEDKIISLLYNHCSTSVEVDDFFAPYSHLYLMLVFRPALCFEVLSKISTALFPRLFTQFIKPTFYENDKYGLTMQPRSSLSALFLTPEIAAENINQFIAAVPNDVLAREFKRDKQLLSNLFSSSYQETTFRLENDEHILFSLTDKNLIKILAGLGGQIDYFIDEYHGDKLDPNLYRFFSTPRLWSEKLAEHTWKTLLNMPKSHVSDFLRAEPVKTYHYFFSLYQVAYNTNNNLKLSVWPDRKQFGEVNLSSNEALSVLLTTDKFNSDAKFLNRVLDDIDAKKLREAMQVHPELSEKLFAEDGQYKTLLNLSDANLLKLLTAIPFAALQAQGKISHSMLVFLSNSRLWESYIFIYDLKDIIMGASSSKEHLTEGLAKDLMAYLVAQQLYPAQTAVGKAFIRDSLFVQQADFTVAQMLYLKQLYSKELNAILKHPKSEHYVRSVVYLVANLNGEQKIDWKQAHWPKTAAEYLEKYTISGNMSFAAIKNWITDFSRVLDHALSEENANRTARTMAIYTKIQSLFQFFAPTLTSGVRADASLAQVSQQGMFSRKVAEDWSNKLWERYEAALNADL